MSPYRALLRGLLLASACSLASAKPRVISFGIDPNRVPQNIAVFTGEHVILTCWKDPFSVENPRIQWWEFAYRADGQLISDDIFLLPSHPQYSRYRLVYDEDAVNQRDLHILNVTLADAGTYACQDGVASPGERGRATAELVVLDGPQRCTTTIPDESTNQAVFESQSLTAECLTVYRGNLVPFMRWNGPLPFSQIQGSTSTQSYSAMQAYADRTMHQQYWQSVVNFTMPTNLSMDAATNPPDHVHSSNTPRITVHWIPTITHIDGIKALDEYLAGDQLECVVDAFPNPLVQWFNQRTGQQFGGTVFTVLEEWVGETNPMRCQAINIVNGVQYAADFYITVRAVPPPTTPTTTQPTTTTPPPAVADCTLMTGRWESTQPLNSYMCIEIDESSDGFGNLHGVLRNGTETAWIDLIGSQDLSDHGHVSWTGIWPENRFVATFIGECSRCHGVDILLVTAISRSKGGPQCAAPGEILYSQEFEFRRNLNVRCPPITIPPLD